MKTYLAATLAVFFVVGITSPCMGEDRMFQLETENAALKARINQLENLKALDDEIASINGSISKAFSASFVNLSRAVAIQSGALREKRALSAEEQSMTDRLISEASSGVGIVKTSEPRITELFMKKYELLK